MSASDVYREMPYHAPKRPSLDAVPLVVSSMEASTGITTQTPSSAEYDDEAEINHFYHMQEAYEATQILETSSPIHNGEVSDAETQLFSVDDEQLTQMIPEDEPIPTHQQVEMHCTTGETLKIQSHRESIDHSSAVQSPSSTSDKVESRTRDYDTTVMEGKSQEELQFATTTMNLSEHAKNYVQNDASVDEKASAVTTMSSSPNGKMDSEPNCEVRDTTFQLPSNNSTSHPESSQAPSSESIPWITSKPGFTKKEESIDNETAQARSEPVPDYDSIYDETEPPQSPPLTSYLNRRVKEAALVTPDRAHGFEFDENSEPSLSQQSIASKKRSYAFLNENSQSQQETQESPPNLSRLAETTLHAAMHVHGYISSHTRLKQEDGDMKKEFDIPPKSLNFTTPSTRRVKRMKVEFSPIPPRTVYATRVKCFAGASFYLSGFEETAGEQLKGQIQSYGGSILKCVEQMKKHAEKCYVIATPEASRRPKILYAMTYGVPIVHPDWLAACFAARRCLDVTGYWIPAGFSWILRRSVVLLPKHQDLLFKNLRFGVPYDISNDKRKKIHTTIAKLMKIPLEHCGAQFVKTDIKRTAIVKGNVDIILSNEFTKLCSVAQECDIPVVRFLWVNECIIQGSLVDMKDPNLAPDIFAEDGTLHTRVVEITLADTTAQQRLCLGELVFVDLDDKPHDILYHICQSASVQKM
ncbi:hypothetical protein Ae201684_004851 [Aphanomyces euteiches]|uniref:BRCT domain-containing protein n=1 Tax=Aphanomyces euteiches TaxID=100861 RepID=A0A6G0XH98_9STRA|nr:hypothetical protein Ae201684_004851 [Aphanomyces euteiches]